MIRILPSAIVALVIAVGYLGWRAESAHSAMQAAEARADQALDALDYTQRTLEQERAKSVALGRIAQQYEQDKADAQDRADRVVADMRAGNERLHQRWQAAIATSELSAASTGPGQLDAGAEDRAESAGRIIAAAAQCDAQVIGLQGVVRADRDGM